jgi:HEAT repeat protein/predicted ATPase
MTAPARQKPSTRYHRGYAQALAAFAQRHHLAGKQTPLAHILVEPRLLRQPPMIAPLEENLTQSVMYNVPLVHEFPYLHASYHLPTHRLEEIAEGDPHIALLGAPGSGKTTALLAIALLAMGETAFPVPLDSVQQAINEEDKALSAEERAERVRQRVLMAQQTRQRLSEDQGMFLEEGEEERKEAEAMLRHLTPLYVHLHDILPATGEYGRTVDSAEPLVRALQAQTSYLTSRTLPRPMYRLLRAGRALVLIDGLSEMPPSLREEKLDWLKHFIAQYGRNRIVVAAPPTGAQALASIGLTPVYLVPPGEVQLQQLAARLAEHGVISAGEESLRAWLARARALPLADALVTLITETAAVPEAWQKYIQRLMPAADRVRPQLERMALLHWQDGTFSAQQLTEPAGKAAASESAANSTAGDTLKAVSAARRLLDELADAGLLMRRRGQRYHFVHPSVAALYAASGLSDEALITWIDQPQASALLEYANTARSLEGLAARLLNAPAEATLAAALRPASWLRFATPDAAWRTPYLRLLATWLVAQHQYLVVRERIAAALISSGDPSVVNVFRRMLQNPNADCRRIGAFALGALRDSDAITALGRMTTQDADPGVQVAAALALGGIGTEGAVRALAQLLENAPNNDVKRACAESLANNAALGYPALYRAIGSPQLDVRRAVVWGLGRLRTDWALIQLNETYLHDREVYVQLAVEQVYTMMYEKGSRGVHQYPALDNIEWVQKWRERAVRDAIIRDESAEIPLVLAFLQQKYDPQIRLMTIVLAGQKGYLFAVDALYKALYDAEEAIRDAAYRSITELALGWGIGLPAAQ